MLQNPTNDQLLLLNVTGFTKSGEALAEDEHGNLVQIFGGIPGETVLAEIINSRRGQITTKVIEVLTDSPHRVTPLCKYFGACTGCQWQHISYQHQLEIKQNIVQEAFNREWGKESVAAEPTIPSSAQFGYRNHARFTVSKNAKLGFVNKSTRNIVEVDECLIMDPGINQALGSLQGLVGETSQLSIRYGVNTKSLMVQPALHSPEIPFLTGQATYTESLLGHQFQVGSPSFFQVNTGIAEQLGILIKDALELTGTETVIDAYAGVSTFAVLLGDYAKSVIAIEESSAALKDAEVNIGERTNIRLERARTEIALHEFVGQDIDAVILDPPRTGCQPNALRALMEIAPRRVVYVSCDPESLARDLKILSSGPFNIEKVQPLDMFPNTHHIECLAVLSFDQEKQDALVERRRITLASSSPRRSKMLTSLGIKFEIIHPNLEESLFLKSTEDPIDIAKNLALAKANIVAGQHTAGTIVGADTIVVMDGEILGKPDSVETAKSMLKLLRGKEHAVITGLAVVEAGTGHAALNYRKSRVRMRNYTDEEIDIYIHSGAPFDKAGAYGIQDLAFSPVEQVRGCYLNVLGFPVCVFLKTLKQFGIDPQRTMPIIEPDGIQFCQDCQKSLKRYMN